MKEEIKQSIINFFRTYYKTGGYNTIHIYSYKDNTVTHELYIPKKKTTLYFKFDEKEILVSDENGKEFIYDIGFILKTMILLL